MKWIWNPKTKGSGIITCIPQKGICPNKCEDCFFQSGRSYLEPLEKNLPHIPPLKLTKGRVVRINDGNDSNIERELVIKTARQFKDYFFNTAIPRNLGSFPAPVVLTLNPGKMTDTSFHRLSTIPPNLMFVRIRTNAWNIETVVAPAIKYYTDNRCIGRAPTIVLGFMAYYTTSIPPKYKKWYEWKKRTLNSYWVLKPQYWEKIMNIFKDNMLVNSEGKKHTYSCRFCGICLREYFATKERIKEV